MIQLRKWQEEAYNKIKNNNNGIIEASTGSGKTIIGLKLIEDNQDKKILIIVPTIILMTQWKKEIIKFGIATEKEISTIGGGKKETPKRITIAVINSLWTFNWQHPLAKFNITIADEVHRYCSKMSRIPIGKDNLGNKIGLTATLKRSDGEEEILNTLIGPTIYTINTQESIEQGYISDYKIYPVPCTLTTEERIQYITIDTELKNNMSIFNNNFNKIKETIQTGHKNVMYKYAITAMKLMQERKGYITRIESKINKAIELCEENKKSKIILFDELQENANKIYRELQNKKIACVLYHSGIKIKDKKEAIKKFTENEVNILISVKALDEGLNVKNVDVGIIVNGNSQERQIKQRLGRILRKQENKIAKLYMLYIPGTIDEKYLYKRMEVI